MSDRMLASLRALRGTGSHRGMAAILAGSLALSGCATSISGAQAPITADDVKTPALVCPTEADYSNFKLVGAAEQRRGIRDHAIANCVAAIDAKYLAFKAGLRADYVDTNVITDVLSLGLTGGSALTKAGTAKKFAQGALFVGGVRDTVNADVFFKQTLPAIETTMDANRDTILKNIVQSEKDDSNATNYTLDQASIDLLAYQRAGDLDTAINTLNKTANDTATKAADQLQQQQARHYADCSLDPAVETKIESMTAWLHGSVDGQTLAAAYAKLNMTPPAGDQGSDLAADLAGSIIDAANGAACDKASQQAAVQPFSDALASYMSKGSSK